MRLDFGCLVPQFAGCNPLSKQHRLSPRREAKHTLLSVTHLRSFAMGPRLFLSTLVCLLRPAYGGKEDTPLSLSLASPSDGPYSYSSIRQSIKIQNTNFGCLSNPSLACDPGLVRCLAQKARPAKLNLVTLAAWLKGEEAVTELLRTSSTGWHTLVLPWLMFLLYDMHFVQATRLTAG